MRTTWTLSAIAVAALLSTAGVTFAQTATPAPSASMYESCRDQAIAQNLVGEARGNAISRCMTTATNNPNVGRQHSMYEACRDDAIARNLAGEARATAINQCVSVATIEPAAGGQPYSAETCRAGAIARGLSGDALSTFMNSCTRGR